MRLKVASYNIHKAVGTDGARDADRILAVLHELDADVVALQEADRRTGTRATVLPRAALAERHWQVAACAIRPLSLGWHGNAVLVRAGMEIEAVSRLALPMLEPRGAVTVRLALGRHLVAVTGAHLDLSGLRRRAQVAALASGAADGAPAILMGDFNEWSPAGGALRALGAEWTVQPCGRSFPARRPLATLDRIVTTAHWRCHAAGVHHSALAARASDHLPVWAELEFAA